MKFTLDRSTLDEALKTVQFALLTRPSLPILSNVKICAQDGRVTFMLTDLEIGILCSAEADVTAEGETTVPSRTLISIIRRLPERPVDFSLGSDEFIEISSEDINYRILGINASEFPEVFTKPEESSFTVKKSLIKKMLISTSFAVGKDLAKAIITGPLLKVEEDMLTCAATDGKRLARYREEINCDCSGSCVIPPKTNNALMKLMSGDGDVSISFNDKSIYFEFENDMKQHTVISSKLIEGKFPKYEAIIPDAFESELELPREELFEALKRVSLILEESDQGVKLTLSDNNLKIHAKTEDDESMEDIEIDWNGDESVIAFNPVFIMDPLKRLESKTVTLSFNDTRSAAAVKCGGTDFLYILMPMRM